jgi:hypothetical protein
MCLQFALRFYVGKTKLETWECYLLIVEALVNRGHAVAAKHPRILPKPSCWHGKWSMPQITLKIDEEIVKILEEALQARGEFISRDRIEEVHYNDEDVGKISIEQGNCSNFVSLFFYKYYGCCYAAVVTNFKLDTSVRCLSRKMFRAQESFKSRIDTRKICPRLENAFANIVKTGAVLQFLHSSLEWLKNPVVMFDRTVKDQH